MEVNSCVKVTKATSGVFDPTSGITVKHFERSMQPKEVWSILYFTGIDEKDSRYNKLAKLGKVFSSVIKTSALFQNFTEFFRL